MRVANITNSLYHNPLPVIGPKPEVITYSDVKNLIFAGLYSPIPSFPYIANMLKDIETGDGSRFAELLRAYHDFSCPSTSGAGYSIIPLRNRTAIESVGYDGTMEIACSDGDDQSDITKAEFKEYAKELAEVSPSIGSMWSTIRMQCIHYSIRPFTRFVGPWEAQTSHPVLMVGNTMDPVTPVRNAYKMVKGFPGAIALTQVSAGHCSSSTYSKCTTSYIQQYFQTGKMPPNGTICEADEMPFGPGPNTTAIASSEVRAKTRGHAELNAALQDAGGAFMKAGFGSRFHAGW